MPIWIHCEPRTDSYSSDWVRPHPDQNVKYAVVYWFLPYLHPQAHSLTQPIEKAHSSPTITQVAKDQLLRTEEGTVHRRFDSRSHAAPPLLRPLSPFVVSPRPFSHLDAKWPSPVAGGRPADGRDTASRQHSAHVHQDCSLSATLFYFPFNLDHKAK